jgi:hypothetical protein
LDSVIQQFSKKYQNEEKINQKRTKRKVEKQINANSLDNWMKRK